MLLRRVTLVLAVLCACDSPPVVDGGGDTAMPDAARDARSDGRPDTRPDTRPRDTGAPDVRPDGGPNDPVWVPMPNVPAPCAGRIFRAEHPERIYTPTWGECDPPHPGCRETGETRSFIDSGGHDGEQGYFVFADGNPHSGIAEVRIGRTDGPSIAAWRYVLGSVLDLGFTCIVGPHEIADGYAGFVVDHLVGDDREASEQQVYHAPLADIGTAETPIARIPGHIAGYSSPQHIALSRHLVALEMQPGGFVYRVLADGTQENVSGTAVGIPQQVHVSGEQIFWADWNFTVRLARAGPTRLGEIAWDPAPGEVRSLAVSSDIMAWLQGYDRPPGEDFTRLELWTAPVPAIDEPLDPELVTEVVSRPDAAVGHGYYVRAQWLISPPRVELTELSSGRTKSWPIPDGHNVLGAPIFVAENDIGIVHLTPTGRRLVRLDPSAMPYDE